MRPARVALAIALVAGSGYVASRIVAGADAGTHGADASPREILAARPLAGHPFADLARAETDPARKFRLHEVAARRAPRDLRVRAWLVEHHLAAANPTAAMQHLDVLLRLADTEMRSALFPAVVQLAADPAFASALVDVLARSPAWERAMLRALRGQLDAPGASLIHAGLRERGALSEDEAGRWLNALIGAGRWGEAYSLWSSGLDLGPSEPLPMLWDGGFDREPTGHGFGWRITNARGSHVTIAPGPGTDGPAARMVFLGRAVARGNLEQPLHLPPGAYRIRMSVKADALRSDQGLAWELTCAGGQRLGTGEPVKGTFDWREYDVEFDVPVTECAGQWLRLRNPAPAGPARMVSGELWVDNVTLTRTDEPS